MAFDDSPLPRTQRGLNERRAAALGTMRRAARLSYVVAVLNLLAGYYLADGRPSALVALLPALTGLALAVLGYSLTTWHSPWAAIGLLAGTVAVTVSRWMAMGRAGPIVPAVVALYIFWQGFEAAREWQRLRDHVVPASEDASRAG